MAAVRAVLIAIVILAMAVTPLVIPSFGASPESLTAYASFAGGSRTGDQTVAPQQAGDNNGGDNGDNGGDNNGNGNSNNNGNSNHNSNKNSNGNGNDNTRVVFRNPRESVNRPTKCFDTREVSTIQMGTGSYDVTVQVMPHSSFNQTTRMTLRALDPSSVPSTSAAGTLIDRVVFALDAQASCDGVAIGTLPNTVNMGIIYNVTNAVDKSKLQIVKLEGSSWTNVATVVDPVAGNPYVSTSIMSAGTYALFQKP